MHNARIAVAVKLSGGEVNPFDAAALEWALTIGGEVTVLAMAPAGAAEALAALTRLGARAVLVTDPHYAGADTLATARTLAAAVGRLRPDCVFCGRQSMDGSTAQVPPMLAELLGFSLTSDVMGAEDGHWLVRSGEKVPFGPRRVVVFERCAALRFPSLLSRPQAPEIWDNAVLRLPPGQCGQRGSPTRVVKAYESTAGRRRCRFVSADELPALIRSVARQPSERPEEAPPSEKRFPLLYYAGDIGAYAERLAVRAVRLDTEGRTAGDIAREIAGAPVVLWEDTPALKELAARTAVRAGAGLCADCIAFRCEDGAFVMTRPAAGGNVTADIVCTGTTAMATVRSRRRSGGIVLGIGRGAAAELAEITRAAQALGAEIACTRPVADSGLLPYAKQAGLTGMTMAPDVYVALGISGAVQHTCAVEGAGTIVAVNTDREARIFDYADYGAVADAGAVAASLRQLAEKGDNVC